VDPDAIFKALSDNPVTAEVCTRIVREVTAHAHYPDKVEAIADQLYDYLESQGVPARDEVDWSAVARLFLEQERWRALGRAHRVKRSYLSR